MNVAGTTSCLARGSAWAATLAVLSSRNSVPTSCANSSGGSTHKRILRPLEFPRRIGADSSKTHDVVSAVDVEHFACDAGACVGGEKHCRAPDLTYFHVALQRRALGVRLEHVAEVGDAPRGESL